MFKKKKSNLYTTLFTEHILCPVTAGDYIYQNIFGLSLRIVLLCSTHGSTLWIKIKKGVAYVDYRQACGWPGWNGCNLWKFSQGLMECCSSSSTYCPWGLTCECFQKKQCGWCWDTRHHSPQLGWTIGDRHQDIFSRILVSILWCLSILMVSLSYSVVLDRWWLWSHVLLFQKQNRNRNLIEIKFLQLLVDFIPAMWN